MRWLQCVLLHVCWILSILAITCPAHATVDDGIALACPEGNLLENAVITPGTPSLDSSILFDGAVASEGEPWPSTTVMLAARTPLTFDLRAPKAIRHFFVQTDADQAFDLAISLDGVSWSTFHVRPDPTASGMLSRTFDMAPITAEFVRLSPAGPSRTLAITEFQAACGHLERIHRAEDPARLASESLRQGSSNEQPLATPSSTLSVKFCIAVGAFLLLTITHLLTPAVRLHFLRPHSTLVPLLVRSTRALLGTLAAIAVLAYFNFGAFHFPEFAHEHDIFHYFIGAKYFPELGYTSIYDCAAAAEAEAGFPERVSLRSQRDLRTNAFIDGATVLARSTDCRRRFSQSRWQKFVHDVRFFANARDLDYWNTILRDHGFNASPAWIAVARTVVRNVPATPSVIGRSKLPIGVAASLDPLLLFAGLGALAFAFDFTTASVTAIVFCCNPLVDFSWVGGGFLRQLWLVALVFALALLRRKHWVLGGMAAALSALLQLFPIFCLLGVAGAVALERRRTRRWSAEGLRILAGAAAFGVVLAVASPFAAQRTAAWQEFVANTTKHAQTPSVNLVGLKTILSFRTATRAAVLFDPNATDPFARVRDARLENFRHVAPLFWLGIVFCLGLFTRVLARPTPWHSVAAIGLLLTPILIETSCYYTAWIALVATALNERIASALVPLAAVASLLALDAFVSDPDLRYAADSAVVAGMAIALFISLAASRNATPVRAAS